LGIFVFGLIDQNGTYMSKTSTELEQTEWIQYNNSLDLDSMMGKILPPIKTFGQIKNISINSVFNSALKIIGDKNQIKSVFRKLFYLLIREFDSSGTIDILGKEEGQFAIITINVLGTLKFEIAYDSFLSIEYLFSNNCVWKKQVSSLLLISHALKENGGKISINKISSTHRIISIILLLEE
jgi:hypothetical protein